MLKVKFLVFAIFLVSTALSQTCYGKLNTDPTVCNSRGVCAAPDVCVCMVGGYGGSQCQLPICYGKLANDTANVCSGRGTCVAPDVCSSCPVGYGGGQCQLPICYGKLANDTANVCSGRGTCVAPDVCSSCPVGYGGSSCQLTSCFGYWSNSSLVCSSRGTCVAPNTCNCSLGFNGSNCESSPFTCFNKTSTDPTVCSGRGNCVANNTCSCAVGYGGTNCHLPTCNGILFNNASVCNGRGTCYAPNSCVCNAGYGGSFCELVIVPFCNGLASSNPSVCSSSGVCVDNNLCSCNSGRYGNNCQLQASKVSCTWNNVSQTVSGFYPTLDGSRTSLLSNFLNISLRFPIVNNRTNSTIYLQSKSYTQCMYPGIYGSNTLYNINPCWNRLELTVPWSVASQCGWNVDQTADFTTYRATVFSESMENVGDIRGYPIQRKINSGLPLMIRFKRTISLFSLIQLDSQYGLYSAITSTLYTPGPPVYGQFEVLTALQYPYAVNTTSPVTFSQYPAGLVPTATLISAPEECNPTQCIQRWRIDIEVSTACAFTGTYKMDFMVGCLLSTCDNQPGSATLQVNSEDFCATTTIDIGLSGTMISYADNGYLIPKSTFTHGNRANFRLFATASQVPLTSTRIKRVQWESGPNNKLLFDEFASTADGVTQFLQIGTTTSSTAGFGFLLHPSWIPVPIGATATFNVSAVIQVSYSGVAGDFTREFEFFETFGTKEVKNVAADGNYQETRQRSVISVTATETQSAGRANWVSALVLLVIAVIMA